MRNRMILLTMTALGATLLFAAGIARAQTDLKPKGSGGWGPGSNYSKLFDPKAMVTIKGKVTSVDTLLPSEDMFKGTSVDVRTATGDVIPVHLGPQWYLENQDVKIAPNDDVEVRGSRIVFNGKPAIIAVTVIKSGLETLRLRDENGAPRWSATIGADSGASR